MLKICLLLALVAACLAEINYKDPSQPVEARVQALLAQMTLEERQAQVFSIHNKPTKEEYSMYEKTSIGAQKVSGFDENTPESLIAARNDEQRHFFENSRLGIPAAWHQETLNSAGPGATLFPLSIGLGATWNVSLMHDIGSVVARECRALGLDAAYSPEVNLYTDPRNGRGQEAFSEEPYLTGEMGVAMTLGIQGGTDGAPCGPQCYSAQDKVGAVGKHYVAYGAAQGGINAGVAALSEYTMRDVYVRPWRELVARAGLRAAMRSHEAWDALPLHANNYMAEVLNKELGFDLSWTISDCGDIELLRNFEFAWSEASAAALALNASVDVENQCGSTVYRHVIEAIQSGLVDEAMLNRSAARVLRHKFSLGLFDRPYVNATLYKSVLRAKSHLETSREAAKQSIVLLKNSGGVLPLSEGSLSRVALVGPNGGCVGDPSPKNARCDGNGGCEAQCSLIGKTFHPIGESVHVKTVEMIFNERRGTTVPFARGANINNMTDDASLVNAALAVAAQSDVVIAVLGDSMDSCSENSHLPKVDESGGGDRDSLDLPGTQETLLRALVQHKGATQKLIVVLVNGRAVTFGADNALLSGIDALLVAYRPGESGATAIYDVLTGAEEPTGRLSQSWPRNVGQVGGPSSPTLHQIVADWGDNTKQFTRGYFLSTAVPLFPFGFGLSYTTLDIKTASVSNTTTPLPRHPSQTPTAIAHVRVTVANVGTVRQGATVVQVYAHDPPYTGVVRYFRRLVAFAKTPMINPGDSVTLDIPITDRSLAYTSSRTTAFEHRLYPGDYQLWVSQAQIDASEIALKLTLSE